MANKQLNKPCLALGLSWRLLLLSVLFLPPSPSVWASDDSNELQASSSMVLRSLLPEKIIGPAYLASDDKVHITYELMVYNFSPLRSKIKKLQVFDADLVDPYELMKPFPDPSAGDPAGLVASYTGEPLYYMFSDLSDRLGTEYVTPMSVAVIWMDVIFDTSNPNDVPSALAHRLIYDAYDPTSGNLRIENMATLNGKPILPKPILSGKSSSPLKYAPVVVYPPLQGEGYVAADACCDSVRHRRAILSVNGNFHISQRFAVDWERLAGPDKDNLILFHSKDSDPSKVEDYLIYGDLLYSCCFGTVVATLDGLPDQPPGSFPSSLPLSEALGNGVVIRFEHGHDTYLYAFYAHMKPGTVMVEEGQEVAPGDILGRVGNSGNTIAPHLHFQITDGPLLFASNGVPYVLNSYNMTGKAESIEAFDASESDPSLPLPITQNTGEGDRVGFRKNAYHLNLVVATMTAGDGGNTPKKAKAAKTKGKKQKDA